jgi:S1-C subfamily serine protease
MGFAIPVNMARTIIDQIMETGEIRRGSLGITIDDPTPDVIRELQIISAPRGGAIIVKVDRGSPGARAGLKSGDIVTEIGTRPVRDSAFLRPAGAPAGRRRGRAGRAARWQAAEDSGDGG